MNITNISFLLVSAVGRTGRGRSSSAVPARGRGQPASVPPAGRGRGKGQAASAGRRRAASGAAVLAIPGEFHALEPKSPTEKKQYPAVRCRICYRNKLRKETKWVCKTCPEKPGLCIKAWCFKQWHTELGLGVYNMPTEE